LKSKTVYHEGPSAGKRAGGHKPHIDLLLSCAAGAKEVAEPVFHLYAATIMPPSSKAEKLKEMLG
jgi:hypothetical protein